MVVAADVTVPDFLIVRLLLGSTEETLLSQESSEKSSRTTHDSRGFVAERGEKPRALG
jgi:hypothetical protein